MRPSYVEILLMVLLPLGPAITLFFILPNTAAVQGALWRLKIKLSGSCALYFCVMYCIYYYLSSQLPQQRDQLTRDFLADEQELREARDKLRVLNSSNAAKEVAGLNGQIEELSKKLASAQHDLEEAKHTGNQSAEVWTVRGQIEFKSGSNETPDSHASEDATYSDVAIVMLPPPNIDSNGVFELRVIKTFSFGDSPDFPTIRFEKRGFQQPSVRLNQAAPGLGKAYKKLYNLSTHEIILNEPVILTHLNSYSQVSSENGSRREGVSK